MNFNRPLSRRDFIKTAALGLGGLALQPLGRLLALPEFPQAERLGRVVYAGVELKERPDEAAQTLRRLAEDEVVVWQRAVVGSQPYQISQNYVETPEGYVYAPSVQPVADQRNTPLKSLPPTSLGDGLWVEVSVPFVDLILDNPPARAPWLQYRLENSPPPRLYYSQIVWVDRIRVDESGQAWYRVNERYGYGDIFWAAAEAFRPLTLDEMAPLSPEVDNKRILVNVSRQSLSCYEGQTEVYYCRVSTGALYNAQGERVDTWATPPGAHPVWRKLVSLHMSGGTTGGGWDLPGIGWTTLFVGSGVAVHSTFWHNNFGVPMSRGCVNARPDDARWVFRWTLPIVPYDPGDVSVSLPGGTVIEVTGA